MVVEDMAGEVDVGVGDGESAGRNRVDSCVVGDFETWTIVGTVDVLQHAANEQS